MKLLRKPVSLLLSFVMIFSVFTIIPVPVQAAEVCIDILTVDDTGATRTNYVNWTARNGEDHPTIESGAVYSGNSAKGNGGIQMRSKSQSGVVTTGTGGNLRKITVAWIDTYQNDDKNLDVYGTNTAYTSAADLYSDARGTLLETFGYNDASYSDDDGVYYSELEITDDYRYFGIRSKSGALYLSSVTVDWEIFDVNRVWNWADDYSSATCTFTDESGSHTEAATITSEVTKQPSYLAEGVLSHTATVICDGVTYRDVQTEPIAKPVFGGSVPYNNENGDLTDSPEGTVLLAGDEGALNGGWYTFAADTSVSDLTFNGDCKLVLCDGVTVTSKDHFNVNGTLTVYGQTNNSGTLAGIASGDNAIISGSGSLIINGGAYQWVVKSGYGCVEIHAGNLTVNGGSFTNCNLNADSSVTVNGGTVNNDENTRINCPNGTVTVSGGDILLRSDGSAVDCNSFVYNGGSFKAENGLDGFVYSRGESVTLSWTNESDSIHVGQYGCWVQEDVNTMRFDGVNMTLLKAFVDQDGNKYPAGTYFSDNIRYKTLRPDVDRWNQLQQQINASESGDVIQLTSDCIASSNDLALVVSDEKELLTIDLNGYTIDRGLADKDALAGGNVITNHAVELHIIDTSAKKTGKITGGNNTEDGGGIISDVDTLYLENVTVSGNKSAGNGGGIWAKYYVEMKNCEVTDNVAGGNGGGIYWHKNISGNKLVVSGSVRVTGNSNSDGSANNVYLPGSQVFINVTDALNNDTLIGVSTPVPEKTITSGLSGKGSVDNFRSDSESWMIGAASSGEAILKKPYVIRFDSNGGSGEMEDIVTLDSPVTMPECTFTAPEGKRFKAWSDGYGNTIEEDEEVGLTPGIYEYTIAAVWADVYTITVADSTGGTIKTNKLEAIEGERVRLTLTPDTGYRIDQVYVSYNFNQHADVVNNSYFLMPAASVTVKAFWTQEHTITLDCWNCTAQTNLEKAFKGDTITVTVTPDDGCVLNSIDAYYYGEYHTLSGNTFTMPADDVTVYVNCLVGTPYIDGDGEEKLAAAYTFGMPSNVNSLWDHWYAVDEDIEFDHDVEIRGNVNLILCDGATLSFTKKEDDSDCGRFVFKGNSSLTIYGQSEGTGKFTCADNVGYMSIYSEPTDDYDHGVLTMNGGALEAKTFGQIIVDEVNINRGTVKNFCVYARGDITVNGGTIEVDEKYDDEFYKLIESGYGDVIINGGTIDLDVYSTGISSDEKDVRITGGDLYLRTTGASDAGIRAENNVTITGGRIVIPETEGRGIYVHGESGQISLSWTSLSDSYDISTFERWSKDVNRVVGSDVIINRCFNCDNDGNKYAVAPGVISDNSIWDGTLTPKCFAGHSLTLNGDIGVNFFFDVPASDAANAKVEFSYTVGGKEKKSSVELKNAELTAEGYKATCYVSAPEMTDDITAVLSFGEDEFETDHYSVKTYADKLLSDEYKAEYLEKEGNTEETYTKLAALVTAMLNYGGAAQIQFEDQHPNDECGMANDGLAAPAPLTQAELSAIDTQIPDKDAINAELDGTGLTFYGYTMLLHTKTALRFYFLKDSPDADISGIRLSFGTGDDTVTCDAQNYNERYAYVEAEDIPAYELNNAYTLTVNGKDLGSYSALSYVRSVLTEETADETPVDTVTAMYRYHEAAVAYFPMNNG